MADKCAVVDNISDMEEALCDASHSPGVLKVLIKVEAIGKQHIMLALYSGKNQLPVKAGAEVPCPDPRVSRLPALSAPKAS